jgi:hypothetical protein
MPSMHRPTYSQGAHPSGDKSGAPARRPARVPPLVCRVERRARPQVETRDAEADLVHGGLADQDGAHALERRRNGAARMDLTPGAGSIRGEEGNLRAGPR